MDPFMQYGPNFMSASRNTARVGMTTSVSAHQMNAIVTAWRT
jgi:hypothetical protein